MMALMRRVLAVVLALTLPLPSAAVVSRTGAGGASGAAGAAAPAAPAALPPALPSGLVLPENPHPFVEALAALVVPGGVVPPAAVEAAAAALAPPPLPPATIGAPVPAADLAVAAGALAGDAEAGRQRPGLAALGSDAQAPSPDAGAEEQSSAALDFFLRKIGLRDELDGPLVSAPAAAPPSGRGKRRKKKDEKPPAPPKYPARDVFFKKGTPEQKVFPSVAFRPDRPIEPLLIEAIDAAKTSIHIATYEFKQQGVLEALRRAKKRGVAVHILFDFDNAFPTRREGSDHVPHRSFELQALINEGFDVTFLNGMWRYGIQHNKFAVFDGELAFFGSYNLSYTAERNHFENARFMSAEESPRRVQAMLRYWEWMRGMSLPFEQAREAVWPKERPAPPADDAPSVRLGEILLPEWVFSPDGGAEDWIVKAIDNAQEAIDLSMFTFRSTRVAEALLRAKKRKVKVRVIFDQSQGSQEYMKLYAEWLAYHKIPVKYLAGPNKDGPVWSEKNHNKFMRVDGVIATGSMNYTKNAFKMSFENLFFLDDAQDAAAYAAYFDDMYNNRRAVRIKAPASAPTLPTDEELLRELLVEPTPLPPRRVWPLLPPGRAVRFRDETFPANAARPFHPIKDYLVAAINASKETIDLALYEFKGMPEIMDALRRARDQRNVRVRVILDYNAVYPTGMNSRGEERVRSPEVEALIREGFEVRVVRGRKGRSSYMHNKVAIFDGLMVKFGSYNWSETAEDNHFETAKFETDAARVAGHRRNWDWLYAASLSVEEAGEARPAWPDPGPPPADGEEPVSLGAARFPRQAFSPDALIEQLIIRAIDSARFSIEIAMFSFYSEAIAEALLRAKQRHGDIKIRILIDYSQAKLMKLDEWFAANGFDVKLLGGPDELGNVFLEKMHLKFLSVDRRLVADGSYNYTANARDNNFENANFYDDPVDAAFYAALFEILFRLGWRPFGWQAQPAASPAAPGPEYFQPAMPEEWAEASAA